MGAAFEVLAGRVTNPGATISALTVNTADTFTVKNAPFETPIYLEGLWASAASASRLRVRSPRLHDNVNGILERVPAAVIRNTWGDEFRQRLVPQDVLDFAMAGGGAETDCGYLLVSYSELPGINGKFASWPQLQPRIVNLLTNEVAPVTSATAGDWSAGRAVNADNDLLKANTDYAVLGYLVSAAVGAVALRGPETGNLRVGGPGPIEPLETRDWFVSISQATGMPLIPIFNSANKGATLVFVSDPAAGATIQVDLILAELSPGA